MHEQLRANTRLLAAAPEVLDRSFGLRQQLQSQQLTLPIDYYFLCGSRQRAVDLGDKEHSFWAVVFYRSINPRFIKSLSAALAPR